MTDQYPIYLVDDDEAVRRSVSFMLKTSGLEVESYVDGTHFLKDSGALDPGCVLLDVLMPDVNGLDVQRELKERGITFPVIVMTGHGDVGVAVKAMKAGAVDFIEKPFAKAEILGALEEGFDAISETRSRSTRKEAALLRLNGLTARERDVLEGLVEGNPNKTIGYDLGISARTVEIHRANLMRKLEVRNLSDLLRIAFAAGLGERDPQ